MKVFIAIGALLIGVAVGGQLSTTYHQEHCQQAIVNDFKGSALDIRVTFQDRALDACLL